MSEVNESWNLWPSEFLVFRFLGKLDLRQRQSPNPIIKLYYLCWLPEFLLPTDTSSVQVIRTKIYEKKKHSLIFCGNFINFPFWFASTVHKIIGSYFSFSLNFKYLWIHVTIKIQRTLFYVLSYLND